MEGKNIFDLSFNIKIFRGLGYIGGAYVSLWFGGWQWGVRFTPLLGKYKNHVNSQIVSLLGVFCLILLIVFIEEPTRGASEHAHVESSSIRQDITYLWSMFVALSCLIWINLFRKTYRLNTIAFTCVVFAVGALSWWTPTLITHAYAIQHGIDDVPPSEKAR